jgi:protein involved in polysaccharide export with SLBB domain
MRMSRGTSFERRTDHPTQVNGPVEKMIDSRSRGHVVALTIIALLIAQGAGHAQHSKVAAASKPLAAGDQIVVSLPEAPGISGIYAIGDDGRLLLPVVGPVAAAGLTAAQLKQQLAGAFTRSGYGGVLAVDSITAGLDEGQVITSGDVLVISVPGEAELSGQFPVQPRGGLVLPMVGEIRAVGMTTTQLAEILRERLNQYVVAPAVTVSVLSGPARTVSILGSVLRQGSYEIEKAPTLLALLAAAGGATPDADLGKVVVVHKGEQVMLGKREGDLRGQVLPPDVPLQTGDAVFIPQKTVQTVVVTGAVVQSGMVLPVDTASTLSRALALAGGPKDVADLKRVYVLRGNERIDVDVTALAGGSAHAPAASDMPMQSNDVVVVPQFEPAPVYVLGEVKTPGPLPMGKASTVSRALALAGGGTDTADLAHSYIIRSGGRTDVDIAAVIDRGDASADAALQAGDALWIPKALKQVQISGEVAKPGVYPADTASSMLALWSLAGPETPDADMRHAILLRGSESIAVDLRALIDTGDTAQNLRLMPGDSLIVPQAQARVYILGAVAKPGPYAFSENETLMDVLGRSGGPLVTGKPSKMMLIRRDPPVPPMTSAISRSKPEMASETALEYAAVREITIIDLGKGKLDDLAMRPRNGDVLYVPSRESQSDLVRYGVLAVLDSLLRR